MTRTFLHSFDPPTESPVAGDTAKLTVEHIENAGIREVLQTPGVAYGAWSILDSLLTPPKGARTPFVFKEPLGQSREVKVALSGLFGRFVARAYLERYFNLSIFVHLDNRIINQGHRNMTVKRRSRGDLPDWIACSSDSSSLIVAEAKGCHDSGGPTKALARAWAQAGRVNIMSKGRKVTVKRIAIATRWGTVVPSPSDTHMAVKDPVDEGEPIEPVEKDAIFLSLLRLHIANLIRPLGHVELSDSLRRLSTLRSVDRGLQSDTQVARKFLDAAPIREVEMTNAKGGLVGGLVTRAGPITDADGAPADQQALSRLDLRPVFVGIERELILAAIEADPQAVRSRLTESMPQTDFGGRNHAGGWIVPLAEE